MKLHCQYSGINYTSTAFAFSKVETAVNSVHPIFYADLAYLADLYKAWQEGRIQDAKDQRLLFLAMLNATNHIDWYCTADPKPKTVAANMELVYNNMVWMRDIMLPSLQLPRFAINDQTKGLNNVKIWMEAWSNIRKDFDRGYRSRSEQQAEAAKKAALTILSEKKYANDGSFGRKSAYLRTLADWAALALDFPADIADFWKQIIRCMSASAALNFRVVDVEELLEYVEQYGDAESVHYFSLLAQVRSVLSDAKGESIADLDFSELITSADSYQAKLRPGSFTEASNVETQTKLAPSTKPEPGEYPNHTQYLVALARWTVANSYVRSN